MNNDHPKTLEQLNEVKVAYENFVNLKGDLFQKKMVPMSEDDIKLVQKNLRFTRRITVPVFCVFAAGFFIWSLYLIYLKDWIIAISMALASIALAFFSRYLLFTYRELLDRKEKVEITGIVTGKKKYKGRYESSYFLTLNQRQEILIAEKEFKQFQLGDIVQYDSLNLERYINHSIILLGKISDHTNTLTKP